MLRLLQCTRLLPATDEADFCSKVDSVSPVVVMDAVRQLRPAYTRVANVLFHDILRRLPERLRPVRHRRLLTLEDLDSTLSQSSAACGGAGDLTYLDDKQLKRLCTEAERHPRDHVMVQLLLTTGLRRQGLLNICTADVPTMSSMDVWVSRSSGNT